MVTIVKVNWLGLKPFLKALEIQNQLARKHLDQLQGQPVRGIDTLLLTEHPPVYTIGIRNSQYSQKEQCHLRKLGAEFIQTNRGGLITFHGPGQLVAYPILNLANYTKSMRWYIAQLEQTIISMCGYLGISATTSVHTGVWIGDRKVAAIGVHGSKFVVTHGIAINCNTDMSWYSHIVPCGIEGKGVTSLSKELGRNVTVHEAIPLFVRAFSQQFNCKLQPDYQQTIPQIDSLSS